MVGGRGGPCSELSLENRSQNQFVRSPNRIRNFKASFGVFPQPTTFSLHPDFVGLRRTSYEGFDRYEGNGRFPLNFAEFFRKENVAVFQTKKNTRANDSRYPLATKSTAKFDKVRQSQTKSDNVRQSLTKSRFCCRQAEIARAFQKSRYKFYVFYKTYKTL